MVVDYLSMSSVNFAIPDFCSLIPGKLGTFGKLGQKLGTDGTDGDRDRRGQTGRSPIYYLHLKEIHNLNVTSDLAAHPGSSRICQRECSE
jgi:hypothetical protein